MKDISDLKLVGIDDKRPPMIRKEPYIELFFKLNHKASKDWCSVFNELTAKGSYPVKIKTDEGLFVETWVRSIEEIPIALGKIQKAIKDSVIRYVERIEAQTRSKQVKGQSTAVSSEQARLNAVIAELKFKAD